jgi:ubiquitin-like modifier-activating enzyme ATG7
LLASFVILSFADLKKYKFYYWFGFPAIHSDPAWVSVDSTGSPLEFRQGENPDRLRGEYLSSLESTALVDTVQTWSYGVDSRQRGFFLARKQQKPQGESAHTYWQVASLSEYENGFFTKTPLEHRYICFADPSNYENTPGWMLRNLLVVAKERWGLDRVQILRYRDIQSKRDQGRSVVIRMQSKSEPAADTVKAPQIQSHLPKITGWERNPAGKLSGRTVNLAEYMDPTRYYRESKQLLIIRTDFCSSDWRINQST